MLSTHEDGKPARLPEALRDGYVQKYGDIRDGKIKVPLMTAYRHWTPLVTDWAIPLWCGKTVLQLLQSA